MFMAARHKQKGHIVAECISNLTNQSSWESMFNCKLSKPTNEHSKMQTKESIKHHKKHHCKILKHSSKIKGTQLGSVPLWPWMTLTKLPLNKSYHPSIVECPFSKQSV